MKNYPIFVTNEKYDNVRMVLMYESMHDGDTKYVFEESDIRKEDGAFDATHIITFHMVDSDPKPYADNIALPDGYRLVCRNIHLLYPGNCTIRGELLLTHNK